MKIQKKYVSTLLVSVNLSGRISSQYGVNLGLSSIPRPNCFCDCRLNPSSSKCDTIYRLFLIESIKVALSIRSLASMDLYKQQYANKLHASTIQENKPKKRSLPLLALENCCFLHNRAINKNFGNCFCTSL